MKKTYVLGVFLLLVSNGQAQLSRAESAFSIVSPPEQDMETERIISVTRLRHKLGRKAAAAYARAEKFVRAGALQNGVRELQKAVAFDPEFPEAHGNLGAQYVRLGLVEDALKELRCAAGLDPRNSIHHANLAIALVMVNRLNEAEVEAQSAVSLDGTNFRAQYMYGVLLARKASNWDSAIPHLVYAGRFVPESHLTLAQVYSAQGAAPQAQAELSRYNLMQDKLKNNPVRSAALFGQ